MEIKNEYQNNFHGNNRMDMFEIWSVIQKVVTEASENVTQKDKEMWNMKDKAIDMEA